MERRIGRLWADVVEPESAKFTAPLVLVHGLWSTAALWRGFVGYLAHRGWLCVSVQLHRDGSIGRATSVATHTENLRSAIAALPAPPVVIGHDLGALLAFQAADAAVAVVALAPLVAHPLAASPLPPLWLGPQWIDRWRRRLMRAPGGRWHTAYAAQAHGHREPRALVRELLNDDIDIQVLPTHTPRLIIAGGRDPITSVAAARALAARSQATLRIDEAAAHAIPVEPGWDRCVSDVHRWIVHQLGRPLLALYDESLDME